MNKSLDIINIHAASRFFRLLPAIMLLGTVVNSLADINVYAPYFNNTTSTAVFALQFYDNGQWNLSGINGYSAAPGTGGTFPALPVNAGTAVRVVWRVSGGVGYPNVAMLQTNGAESYTVWGPSDETTPTWQCLPVVTLGVYDSYCEENPQNTGQFRIGRSGSTANALTVYFTGGGNAVYSASAPDYYFTTAGTGLTSSQVTIPVGYSEIYLVVWPYADSDPDPNESVQLTLVSDSSYYIPSTHTGTYQIVIVD
jgi:hypothetical protein